MLIISRLNFTKNKKKNKKKIKKNNKKMLVLSFRFSNFSCSYVGVAVAVVFLILHTIKIMMGLHRKRHLNDTSSYHKLFLLKLLICYLNTRSIQEDIHTPVNCRLP